MLSDLTCFQTRRPFAHTALLHARYLEDLVVAKTIEFLSHGV